MITTIIVILATVALMIFFNGLYVAAEFSTVAARKSRLRHMAAQGNRMAQAVMPIIDDTVKLDRYIAACQIGITISSLVLGAYGQNAIAGRLVEPVGELLAWIGVDTAVAETAARSVAVTGVLILLTTLQVIMGELFPKSVAVQYPEKVALAVVVPMQWTLFVLRPLIWLFNGSGNLILRLMGRESVEKALAHSPAEIELLVSESHESGLLDDRERQMLRNAFRLRDLTARQVMIHRTRIVAAPLGAGVADLMDMAIAGGFSRIPIFEESIDDIIGFVHIKDLFRLYVEKDEDVESIIRDAAYVPESMPAVGVWEKLNTRHGYLAIVFDEYGGTLGIISFEDLIEEIFGELQDEFDDEMALVARDKEGRIYLRGDLLVADVNEYLGLTLPTEVADTVSGLIFSKLGRPPVAGDEIVVEEIEMRVESMEDLGVTELSLLLPAPRTVSTFSEWEMAEHD